MLFPRDRPIYTNLSTSFTDFEALLADLAARKFDGCVEAVFPGYRGVLLLANGEVTSAVEERDTKRLTGGEATHGIVQQAKEKGGSLSIYALAPEMLRRALSTVDGEVLYRDMTSSFTDLERLIAKLEEDGLSGYVEILFEADLGTATVFIESGRTVACVLYADGQSATGPEVYESVLLQCRSSPASFNVYRSLGEPTPGPEAAPAPLPARPEAPTILSGDTLRGRVLAVWSEVLACVEGVADGLSRPGRFTSAWKEVLVARAITYPFLDPFAAEFEYKEGAIRFDGPLPANFSRGLGDCVTDTVARLAFQLRRADLESKVRAALADVAERNAAVIEQLQLADDLQELVA